MYSDAVYFQVQRCSVPKTKQRCSVPKTKLIFTHAIRSRHILPPVQNRDVVASATTSTLNATGVAAGAGTHFLLVFLLVCCKIPESGVAESFPEAFIQSDFPYQRIDTSIRQYIKILTCLACMCAQNHSLAARVCVHKTTL